MLDTSNFTKLNMEVTHLLQHNHNLLRQVHNNINIIKSRLQAFSTSNSYNTFHELDQNRLIIELYAQQSDLNLLLITYQHSTTAIESELNALNNSLRSFNNNNFEYQQTNQSFNNNKFENNQRDQSDLQEFKAKWMPVEKDKSLSDLDEDQMAVLSKLNAKQR